MKTSRLLAFLCLFPLPALLAGPALGIDAAVAIARKSLSERGLDGSHHIVSASLARSTVVGSKTHWAVRWSESIPREDRKKEIGIDIAMDGAVVHVVKAPSQPGGRRANQASILDLKR